MFILDAAIIREGANAGAEAVASSLNPNIPEGAIQSEDSKKRFGQLMIALSTERGVNTALMGQERADDRYLNIQAT